MNGTQQHRLLSWLDDFFAIVNARTDASNMDLPE
jgi:hypothetical protein